MLDNTALNSGAVAGSTHGAGRNHMHFVPAPKHCGGKAMTELGGPINVWRVGFGADEDGVGLLHRGSTPWSL